ncbi:dynein axonemal heavy chain 10 [Anabrus simplex]|uniref:dynein axonemal heavy chain 10 n=1 Tax=Anabrus simplex TaxID=316456 RepID=UPI0035A3CE67
MLVAGVVPSIFVESDRAEIFKLLRSSSFKSGYGGDCAGAWNFFIERIKTNLHICVTISPAGVFRDYCRTYRGLVTHATIDYIAPWSHDSLHLIAVTYITEVTSREQFSWLTRLDKEKIIHFLVFVHTSAVEYVDVFNESCNKEIVVTPRHFLLYIFKFLSDLERRKNMNDMPRKALLRAMNVVRSIEEMMERARIKLEIHNREIERLTRIITGRRGLLLRVSELAYFSSEFLQRLKNRYDAFDHHCRKLYRDFRIFLRDSRKPLREALKEMVFLEMNDFRELRSFRVPLPAIKVAVILAGVLVTGKARLKWDQARVLMTDIHLVDRMKDVKLLQVPSRLMKVLVRRIMREKKKGRMERSSKAANNLFRYLCGVAEFLKVVMKAKPKAKALRHCLDKMMKYNYNVYTRAVEKEKMDKVLVELFRRYWYLVRKRNAGLPVGQEVENRLEATSIVLQRLQDEMQRWTEILEKCDRELETMVADSLTSCAFLSYCGPFSMKYRKMMLNDWAGETARTKMKLADPYKLQEQISSQSDVIRWLRAGLCSDEGSVANAMLAMRATQVPIIIDPQLMATRFLKKLYGKHAVNMSFQTRNPMEEIEFSMKYGQVVLYGAEEKLDLFMESLVDFRYSDNARHIYLGNKLVKCHTSFRLYIIFKHRFPKLRPITYSRGTVVDFSVDKSIVEGQCLTVICQKEMKAIETSAEWCRQHVCLLRYQTTEAEAFFLRTVSIMTPKMIFDDDYMQRINYSFIQIGKVRRKLHIAIRKSMKMEKKRLKYLRVAQRGSLLFFIICELEAVHPMYQYSLDSFLEVYKKGLIKSPWAITLPLRIQDWVSGTTKVVYQYVSAGLLQKHKLLFSFLLTVRVLQLKKRINLALLHFFIRDFPVYADENFASPAVWIPQRVWMDVWRLSIAFPNLFGNLPHHIEKYPKRWQKWYSMYAPEEHPAPKPYHRFKDDLKFLLLVRCMRIDRVPYVIKSYIAKHLEPYYATSPQVDLNFFYTLTNHTAPIIYIITPGVEAYLQIKYYAEMFMIPRERFLHVEMGDGMEERALNFLYEASATGYWLLLESCHLVPRFLRKLDDIYESSYFRNQDFRLWLTTDLTYFPPGILQRSLRVVQEPRPTLGERIKNKYCLLNETGEIDTKFHELAFNLMYCIAFMHEVFQERRKFGKWGWNVPYAFSDMDFLIAWRIMKTILKRPGMQNDSSPDWVLIHLLIGQVVYGAQITDKYDLRVLQRCMEEYLQEFLREGADNFIFCKTKTFEYRLPDASDKEWLFTDNFPKETDPEAVGIHRNAVLIYARNEVKEMCKDFTVIHEGPRRRAKEEYNYDPMEHRKELQKIINEIEPETPNPFDVDSLIYAQIESLSKMTSINYVLLQELKRMNCLINTMITTLTQLKNALKGEELIGSEVEEIAQFLFGGEVPNIWKKFSPENNKPLGNWLFHLKKRAHQFQQWIQYEDLEIIWLGGLCTPKAYLTAVRQVVCKLYGWQLPGTRWLTSVTTYASYKDIFMELTRPSAKYLVNLCHEDDEKYIQFYATLGASEIKKFPFNEEKEERRYRMLDGLYMEGARWEREHHQLTSQHFHILQEPMPLIGIQCVNAPNLEKPELDEYDPNKLPFTVPVYLSSQRRHKSGEGLLLDMRLCAMQKAQQRKWIMKGIALVLNSD